MVTWSEADNMADEIKTDLLHSPELGFVKLYEVRRVLPSYT